MSINYIENIKSIIAVIDFDIPARRILEEFLDFSADNAKEIYDAIKDIKNPDIPINYYDVESIYAGCKDESKLQSMCHVYNKQGENGSLKYIYSEYDCKYTKVMEESIIPNHSNFIKQFFNLTSTFGATLVKGMPKNLKKHNYIIKLNDGSNYYIKLKDNSDFFLPLLYRYLTYNLGIYNKNIIKNKSNLKLKHIINRTELSKELYEHTRNFFDDFDFIYAVMRSLNTKKRQEIFKTCLRKNESFANHSQMNDLITYLDTAVYFVKYKMPKRFLFLNDRFEKNKQTEFE